MKIQKYFLLQNKKIKSWIKYWLYIKSKDKNYVLSDILQGTSFYLENSSNKNFNLFQINGNSIQNGTPTPTNPALIKSAGDNINLFDKTANITRGYTYTSTGGTTQLINSFVQEKYLEVESSKDYILSTTNSYTSETDYRLVICEYDSSKNFIKRNLGATQYYKITTSATTKYVRLCASTVTIDELKFEHGSIATPYSPYGMGNINEAISNSDNTQSQKFTIPCQQPMRSIGNVRDGFVKIDGVWYEKHNIGVIESYNGETITTNFMSTTGELSTGAFVQYVLNEPNYIECTQEQIQALESIIRAYTYEPITNINSTDITPAFLKIRYYMEV